MMKNTKIKVEKKQRENEGKERERERYRRFRAVKKLSASLSEWIASNHYPVLFTSLCGCGDSGDDRFAFHNRHSGINSFYYCCPIKIITAGATTKAKRSGGREGERTAVIYEGVWGNLHHISYFIEISLLKFSVPFYPVDTVDRCGLLFYV